MRLATRTLATLSVASLLLAGCASDGQLGLTTASVAPPEPVAEKLDPACIALNRQIAALREEGTASRLGEISKGKTPSVSVKRAALARVAELDRLNWEFQSRCSKYPQQAAQAAAAVKPVPATAAARPATPNAAAAAPAAAAGATGQPIVAVPQR